MNSSFVYVNGSFEFSFKDGVLVDLTTRHQVRFGDTVTLDRVRGVGLLDHGCTINKRFFEFVLLVFAIKPRKTIQLAIKNLPVKVVT